MTKRKRTRKKDGRKKAIDYIPANVFKRTVGKKRRKKNGNV